MPTTRLTRPIPLSLTMLAALVGAFAALAVSTPGAHAHGQPGHAHSTAARSPLLTNKAVAFRQDMRKLWEDHITWTRLAIISLEGGTPDTQATVARLLRNQVDIGNAVRPFYGKAAGQKVTQLLREHILIAADLIGAAKAADSSRVTAVQGQWTANADAIARALHSLNPRYWPLATLKHEMHMHLELTASEALARLHGDWNADVAAYDKVHRHILHMSDVLANGIIKQFPRRFR